MAISIVGIVGELVDLSHLLMVRSWRSLDYIIDALTAQAHKDLYHTILANFLYPLTRTSIDYLTADTILLSFISAWTVSMKLKDESRDLSKSIPSSKKRRVIDHPLIIAFSYFFFGIGSIVFGIWFSNPLRMLTKESILLIHVGYYRDFGLIDVDGIYRRRLKECAFV